MSDHTIDRYRMPNRICATCGKLTAAGRTGREGELGGYGDWHYDCLRRNGVLITRPATVKTNKRQETTDGHDV